MKKCKTPEQQQAWHELLLLTSDPEWYLDDHASERHQELMRILESDVPKNKVENRYQKFLDGQPGLEDSIVDLLNKRLSFAELHDIYPIDMNVFTYVRKKHRLEKYRRVKKPAREDLKYYYDYHGIKKTSEKFNASRSTVYAWLKAYKIKLNSR